MADRQHGDVPGLRVGVSAYLRGQPVRFDGGRSNATALQLNGVLGGAESGPDGVGRRGCARMQLFTSSPATSGIRWQ
jgi:hypothetical protein